MTQPTLTGYDAAHTAAAVYRVPDPGLLRISGEDRADFIQRQTTNDIKAVTPGSARLTVLTSGTARTLDVWRVLAAPEAEEPGYDVITLPGRGAATTQYLQGRIFFMDKVAVDDRGADVAQIQVIGPQTARVLDALVLAEIPAPGAVVAWDAGGIAGRAVGLDGLIARGVLLLAPAADAESLLERLAAAGAESLSPAAYTVLRVEAGLPGPARELTSDFTPLEANLDAAISGVKGCYAGQEVIARQITYDKIARRLALLRLDAPVMVGARVEVEGRNAGVITSAVASPRAGSLALGVLRRQYLEPGTAVSVLAEEGDPVAGIVITPGDVG